MKPLLDKSFRFSIAPALALLLLLVLPGSVSLAPNRTVTVVKSSSYPEFELTSRIISDQLTRRQETVVTQQLKAENSADEERFWRGIRESNPHLVVTIGTRATRSALQYCGNLPVIFTMVLDQVDDNQKSGGDTDFGGITLNIPLESQIEYIKKALPDARRVGYIYSTGSEETYAKARKAADRFGLRLVGEKVDSERDILDALRRIIPEIDVFWMPMDVLTSQNIVFRYVVIECFQNSIPVLSVYRSRAEAGIPIALGVDYEDIGKQTADLVIRRLNNGRFTRPVIDHPRKLLIYINEGVLSNLNLKIPDALLDVTVPVKSGS